MNVLHGVTSPHVFCYRCVWHNQSYSHGLLFIIYRLSSSIHHVMSLRVYTPIVRSKQVYSLDIKAN